MLPPGTIDPDREVADEIAHRFFPDVKDHKHTGLEIAITNALKTRGEAGRQEERERIAALCAERACHFRDLANRTGDHHISDEFLAIAKGFSKARSLALEDKP